jgi:excisionase family DNA binding protein
MVQVLRDSEAAMRLGLRVATIRKMRADGRLPSVRPTGKRAVRIPSDAIDALIRRSTAMGGGRDAA